MATKTLNTRITLKADTTANWSSSTLVLLKGEMAIEIPESGEYKMKIGDGVNTFGKLSYVAMTPTEIKALISSGAVQTVSLSTGTNNGTIAITVDGVKTDNIAVKGLGSAAYTNSGAYATAGHGHSISGITGLQTALDGKAAAGHTHDDRYYTETEMNTKLAGKANSSHSHGAGDISSVNASAIQGVIGLDHLPAGALERCKIVKDDTARFALTKTAVQTGDTVKVTDTGKMYFIVDDSKLSTEAGYEVYTAGSATSVPWSGVTGKPSTFTPSAHKHTRSEITDFPTSMPASDVYAWAKASSKPSYSWSEISSKPSSFTPSSHTHTIANITNLQSTLDSKASNSNTIKGVSANGYWGLATPASNSVDWIRTTSYGLLPSQSGSARSGHSALGTSSWYFSNAYIDSINTSEINIGQPNNSNNGAIELYGASPYIDFHAGGTNTDYTSRIIAYSDRIEFVFA